MFHNKHNYVVYRIFRSWKCSNFKNRKMRYYFLFYSDVLEFLLCPFSTQNDSLSLRNYRWFYYYSISFIFISVTLSFYISKNKLNIMIEFSDGSKAFQACVALVFAIASMVVILNCCAIVSVSYTHLTLPTILLV